MNPTTGTPAGGEAEATYRRLFEDAPLPMWVFEVETLRFLAVNAAAVFHYGYSREEFLAMTILDIRPPEYAPWIRERVRNLTEFSRQAAVHRKKNGELISVEVSGHSTVFAGRAARMMLALDVTERQRTEDALRASEERLRLITETISEVFWMSDPGFTRFSYLSPAFETLFGRNREQAMANPRDYLQAVHPADLDMVLAGHDALQRGERLDHEYRISRSDGTIRWVHSRAFPVRDRAGGLTAIVGLVEDVTDRRTLEKHVHQLERTESVGRLANGIAHDINNILAPVLMGTPLLRLDLREEQREKLLTAMETSAQRGAALVRQLLIFSRGIEGARTLTDPRAVVKEVAQMCEATFPRGINLSVSLCDDARSVHGDATQLQQVVLNLAVNARDAMPEGGVLEIKVANAAADEAGAVGAEAAPQGYVCISVSDTGVGIAPEVAEHIFDPFFTTKDAGKGTGLGLSSVLGIVKSHGGFIRLESEQGAGTTFHVYLPASQRSAAPEPAHPVDHARAALRGQREMILIVDDEEAIRAVLRDTLLKFNYRVVSAQDGVEATAVFAANPAVQLVITDLDMPLMDGVSLTRVLRRMNPAVKVMLSTGVARRGEGDNQGPALQGLEVQHVLHKPYTGETLLRAIREVLGPALARGGI